MNSIDMNNFDENTVGIISREGIFFLKDKREVKKIHKSFYVFCLNRFNNLSASHKTSRSNSVKSMNDKRTRRFSPEINPNSAFIDRKKKAISKDSRHNILLKAGAKYKKIKSEKSLEKQKKELDGCTFFPDTRQSTMSLRDEENSVTNLK